MPKKLATKLKQQEFYCVQCRKRVSCEKEDICVRKVRNAKRKGGVPMLVGDCKKCDCRLHKFVKVPDFSKLLEKYGKCKK